MENKLVLPYRSGIFAAILGATVVILAALTLMAGLPPTEKIGVFAIGVVVLIVLLAGMGVAGWYLLLKPLPANLKVIAQPLLTERARHIVALLLTLGLVNIGLSGIWDEIWHSKYGIPFGEDFLWRPHMMLYFGLTTLIGVGIWSWWTVMTKGKGTLQQRFQANPLLGVSFLAGVFTLYAVGADPVWHSFYGDDLAPWSLPHLLILVLVMFMAVLTIAYHKSLMSPRTWQVKFNLTWRDILLMLVVAGAMLSNVIVMTVQWYTLASNNSVVVQAATTYPTWLLPLFIAFLTTLFGLLILHATRQIGSATLTGVIVIAIRFAFDASLGAIGDGTYPYLLGMPLLIALDVWYAVMIARTQKPPAFWMTALVITAVFGIVGLPLMSALFPYPAVTAAAIPLMLIAVAIGSLTGIWLGQVLGDTNEYRAESTKSDIVLSTGMASKLLYVGYAAFVVLFVATALPPA